MNLIIKVKRLFPDAWLPVKSTNGAAAFDLTVNSCTVNESIISYGSGLAFEFPEGVYGLLLARSSCYKKEHILVNGVGLIDSDYRGEVKANFLVGGEDRYQLGERFGQLLIQGAVETVFFEVDELGETERGTGGFGSTGL
jgi:dUTP pyrophosphatase